MNSKLYNPVNIHNIKKPAKLCIHSLTQPILALKTGKNESGKKESNRRNQTQIGKFMYNRWTLESYHTIKKTILNHFCFPTKKTLLLC